MATVTLTSPANDETGVGNIISGKAWCNSTFTISGIDGEDGKTGSVNQYIYYVDGNYKGQSSGWMDNRSYAISLGGYDYYTSHSWYVKIYEMIDDVGHGVYRYSQTWSFTTGGPPANIRSAFMDSVGVTIMAAAADGIYISFDSGDNWVKKRPDGVAETDWEKVICSLSGVYIVAVSSANAIYRTATGGAGWTAITPAGGDTFTVNKLAMSDDGKFVVVVGQNLTDSTKSCYLSVDYGASWTAKNPTNVSVEWTDCAISNDGTIIGVSTSGYFEVSSDSGVTWASQAVAATAENWSCLSISGDGSKGLVTNLSNDNEFFIGTKTESYSESTWAEAEFTSAGRDILGDATAADQATTLGVGMGDSPTWAGATLTGFAGLVRATAGVLSAGGLYVAEYGSLYVPD